MSNLESSCSVDWLSPKFGASYLVELTFDVSGIKESLNAVCYRLHTSCYLTQMVTNNFELCIAELSRPTHTTTDSFMFSI